MPFKEAQRTTYRIISKRGIGEFLILDAKGDALTIFTYKGWISSTGSARVEEDVIKIKSHDDRDTSFEIFRNKKEIGHIIFNWRGFIVITMKDAGGKAHEYMLKKTGKAVWVLEDEHEKEVLTMRSDTHWSRVSYSYKIRIRGKITVHPLELLIACGYGTNLNTSMVAAFKA